jgi:hypothetical protein
VDQALQKKEQGGADRTPHTGEQSKKETRKSAAICLPPFAFAVECDVGICRLTSIRICGRTSCWRAPCACRSPSTKSPRRLLRTLIGMHVTARYRWLATWQWHSMEEYARGTVSAILHASVLFHVYAIMYGHSLSFPKSAPRTTDTAWYTIINLAQSHSTAV